MRHAVIMAGGSGTRLWPMSRSRQPKQLIPFIGGKCLLDLAFNRLEGLVSPERRHVCAGNKHARVITDALDGLGQEQFLGEPTGRDTLNAVGYTAAVIAKRDPDAVIAVFTADHIIEPVEKFQQIVDHGFRLAEERENALVTFGVAPTEAATGYGYLELGELLDDSARVVEQFREKPDSEMAEEYFKAGPESFLWNSGMFVWKASTLLDCIRRYEPENYKGLQQIADAWDTRQREAVLGEVFPRLKKISVDYAVMEPASHDAKVTVAAVSMDLQWLDVGSWPMFAKTCEQDSHGNAISAGRAITLNTGGSLVASSDPSHLVATIGCEDLIIVHTPDATLVCPKDSAECIKHLQKLVGDEYGEELI